jgi:hypothetical protein
MILRSMVRAAAAADSKSRTARDAQRAAARDRQLNTERVRFALHRAMELTAKIQTVNPLDPAAKVLAEMDGKTWADVPEPERVTYRLRAAAVITSAAGAAPPAGEPASRARARARHARV